MSALTDIMDADIQAVEPECPVSFVWNGQSYTGQKTVTPDSFEMSDAGPIPKYSCQVLVRMSLFAGGAPALNDPIVIASVNHRVNQVEPSQDGVSIVLSLVQDNV